MDLMQYDAEEVRREMLEASHPAFERFFAQHQHSIAYNDVLFLWALVLDKTSVVDRMRNIADPKTELPRIRLMTRAVDASPKSPVYWTIIETLDLTRRFARSLEWHRTRR